MLKKFIFITLILLLHVKNSNADNYVFNFTEEEFKELKVRKVRGAKEETDYTLGVNEKGNYLKATAKNGGASGLGKEIVINLNVTPFINITWKIEKDLSGIDEKSKKGHDFAARVFVIKKTGLTPLSNKAINYVYSSNESVDDYWRSPYTKSSVDYVLSSTKDNFNEWVTVKANVKDHFQKVHELDVDEITGIAIMTDTDQSNKEVISYYQNIYFSKE